MFLKDWRLGKELSQAEVAEALTKQSGNKLIARVVCSWEKGQFPRPAWLKEIKIYTNGKVTVEDFLRQPKEDKKVVA